MAFGGVALKSVSLVLRVIEFCCAAIIIGIFSYFLATMTDHHIGISAHIKAVEGISGVGVIYTFFGFILVCCLGGIAFFSLLAFILDIAFAGAFAYVAWVNREGRHSCRGNVNTFFGSGNTNTQHTVPSNDGGVTFLPSFHTACELETACFAVAIVAAVFFLISAFVELGLMKHHKKEKAFGPSPNNGYTAGSPKRKFWQRKPKRDAETGFEKGDALPAHSTPADMRTSYATESTAVGQEPAINKYGGAGANMSGAQTTPASSGFAPQSTGTVGHQTTTTTTYQPYRAEAATGTF